MRLGSRGNGRRQRSQTVGMDSLQDAELILVAHQRRDISSCLCGWAELGKSHPGHQVAMLREAGLLPDEPEATSKQGQRHA